MSVWREAVGLIEWPSQAASVAISGAETRGQGTSDRTHSAAVPISPLKNRDFKGSLSNATPGSRVCSGLESY